MCRVALWLEHSTGIGKAMGSTPIGDFFVSEKRIYIILVIKITKLSYMFLIQSLTSYIFSFCRMKRQKHCYQQTLKLVISLEKELFLR